jgi:hypothetical protein
MQLSTRNIVLLNVIFCLTAYAQKADRISGSHYPVSVKPDTLYVVTDTNYTESQLLTIQTLQGILAQIKPRIYRISSSAYNVWLNDFKYNYGITVIRSYDGNFAGLIGLFKDEIKTYVICNVGDASTNAAISLCGITNSVAVTADNAGILYNLGIPMLADVRGKDESWFFDNYGSKVNKNIFCFQKDSLDEYLADYSVFGKMITFYSSSFDSISNKIFASFNPNTVMLGWAGDEYQSVSQASGYNTFIHKADYSTNLSVLSNFDAEPKQKSNYDTVIPKENTHTVCFLMTGGENIQWAVDGLYTGSNWYANNDRGRMKLGWTISPALSELAPTVLNYLYSTEVSGPNGRDYFVAGPSGVGYMFPEKYQHLDEYAAITNEYMKKADLRVLNIIGNNDSVKYIEPFLKQSNIDAVLYYSNTYYTAGKVNWIDNKPIINVRHSLIGGSVDAASTAETLNASSTNIYSTDSYSLVLVNYKTGTVGDVYDCVKQLNSNVRVVTPDEFVSLINKNIGQRTNLLQFTPNNGNDELSYLMPGDTGTGYNYTHRWANYNDKIIYKFNLDSMLAKSNGSKDLFMYILTGNEYVISVSDGLDNSWTEMFRWNADSTVHVHQLLNFGTLMTNLHKYYDLGWHELYLKFEDGIKSDAYGAYVYKITVTQPQTVTGIKETGENIPAGFNLEQNYPNPFNPSTRISYQLPNASRVSLKVYDMLGREVSTLVNNEQNAGYHEVMFDGSKLSSGVYFFRMQAGNYYSTKKMVLMK